VGRWAGPIEGVWPGGGNGGHFDFLDFRLLQAFGFGAPVLEPDFDLETERRRFVRSMKT
jgi:hypothetical protein